MKFRPSTPPPPTGSNSQSGQDERSQESSSRYRRIPTTLKYLTITLAVLIISSLPAVADDKDTGVLRVGAIFPLSGAQQAYGNEALDGMNLALDFLRNSDPKLASHIKIITADDKSSPIESGNAARRLLDRDRVAILFGSITSSSTLAIAKVAAKAKKPLVIPAATSPGITNLGPTIFRSCYIDPYQGKILAAFARNHLKAKKAALLINKDLSYAVRMGNAFEGAFIGRGGSISRREFFRTGKKSFRAELKTIARSKADVIIVPSYHQEAGIIMKQLFEMGINIPIVGGDGWDNPDLSKFAGPKAVAGHFYSVHFSTLEFNQSSTDFVERFKKKTRRYPSSLAAMTYDGMLLIARAYKKSRSIRSKPLTRALSRIKNLPGVIGRISINKERNAEKIGIILETTPSGGKFKAIIDPFRASPKQGS